MKVSRAQFSPVKSPPEGIKTPALRALKTKEKEFGFGINVSNLRGRFNDSVNEKNIAN